MVENKLVEIKLHIPGKELFAKRNSISFEAATDEVTEALRRQILKQHAWVINKENNSMYMFMEKEDFIMINQVVPFQLSSASGSLTSKEYKITFEEEVSPIPKSCNMRVGLGDGMLSLYDGDTIYLTVYKDSMATSNTV